jgi:hypothetical protein
VVRAFQRHPLGPEFDSLWERISGWGYPPPSRRVIHVTTAVCSEICTWPTCPGHPVACPSSRPSGGFLDPARKIISFNANVVGMALPPPAEFFFIIRKLALIISYSQFWSSIEVEENLLVWSYLLRKKIQTMVIHRSTTSFEASYSSTFNQ